MMMIVTLAHVAFVQNGSESDAPIQPRFLNRTFTAPSGCNMMFMIIRDTNCGTAMESTKQNLQNAFPFVSLRLMTIARIMPRM